MNYPSRHVADLVRWGKPHNVEYEGIAQSGHAKFRLPNGEAYMTAASPSDRNATHAARRDISRKLGIEDTKGRRAGRFKKGTRSTGFSMDAAVRESSWYGGTYSTGNITTPTVERLHPGEAALRAEAQRLRNQYAAAPSGALEVQIRNVEARLELGIFE